MRTNRQQKGFAIFELVLIIGVVVLAVVVGVVAWQRFHSTAKNNTTASTTTASTAPPATQAKSASTALKAVDLASLKSSIDQVKSVISGLTSQSQ